MSVLEILGIGHPVLRERARELRAEELASPEIQRLNHGRVDYRDRDGVERSEVKRGLTAGTFQHEVDHLDGILFVDRVVPRTLTTWEQYEWFGRAEIERRARELVERIGS